METSQHKLAWRITVPIVAILMVIAIVIYTGGFGNFLKFLGIKASQLETITLTTNSQMEGDSTEDWLVLGSAAEVTGAAAFSTSDIVPTDPNDSGFVMSIFSDENPSQDIYPEHEYISPAMDLSTETPILSAFGVQTYVPQGTNLKHAYRTAGTVEELQGAPFQTVEVATEKGTEISTVTTNLGVPVSRYIQVQVKFQNNDALTRGAVYSWTLQYDPNLEVVDEGAPDTIVLPPIDEEQPPVDVVEEPAEVEETAIVTLDFSEASELPEKLSLQVLKITVGSQSIIETPNLATEQIAPLYNLSQSLESGYYVLVLRSGGYEAMVLPFRLNQTEPKIIKVEPFIKAPAASITFDLNQDGVVNSLDVSTLLQQINRSAS